MQSSIETQAAAYYNLLGLDPSINHGPATILPALIGFSNLVLNTTTPDPMLTHLIAEYQVQQYQSKTSSSARQQFIDINTGIRLRYLEWPKVTTDDDDVVLLLHDIAQSADTLHILGSKFCERGYKVYALDIRGHGGSAWSSDKRYSAEVIAQDVKAFILAKDLYVRPVAMIGFGMGAIVSLVLSQIAPRLVGALVLVEFGLPPSLVKSFQDNIPVTNTDIDTIDDQRSNSKKDSAVATMPWWSWWWGQTAEFMSIEECAAFIAHPLLNLGPQVVSQLTQQQQLEPPDEATSLPSMQATLRSVTPSPRAAVAAAFSMLKGTHAATLHQGITATAAGGGLGASSIIYKLAVDPSFSFSFDTSQLIQRMKAIICPLLVLHLYSDSTPSMTTNTSGSWVTWQEAEALTQLAIAAPHVAIESLPACGHYFPALERPNDIFCKAVEFIESPAAAPYFFGHQICKQDEGRRPESLGLRPLPEFESIEQAKKALGPRQIPTPAAIEAELAKLKVDEEEASDEDNEESACIVSGQATALTINPPDYFGFVG